MSSVFADAIANVFNSKEYEVLVKVRVLARNPADAIRKAMDVEEQHKAVTIADVREV